MKTLESIRINIELDPCKKIKEINLTKIQRGIQSLLGKDIKIKRTSMSRSYWESTEQETKRMADITRSD